MTSKNTAGSKSRDTKEKPIPSWEKAGIIIQGIVMIFILLTILLTNQTLKEAKKSNEMLKNTYVRSYMPWIDVGTDYSFQKIVQDGETKMAISFKVVNKSDVPASILDANFDLVPVSNVDIIKKGKKTNSFSSTIIFPNDSVEFVVVKEFDTEYNKIIEKIRNREFDLNFNITFKDILELNQYFTEKRVKYKEDINNDSNELNGHVKFKSSVVHYKFGQIVD